MDLLADLNPEQKQAVTHTSGPLLLVAGAGTGKTTVIVRRIGWLIHQGLAKPDEILALTFTEKAAEEMEERIDRLLPYGYFDLWVSTFHAFCEKILRSHALDIGLPNNFTLLDTTSAWLLIQKHLHRFNLAYYRPLGNPTKFIHALIKHFSRAKDECITPEEYIAYAQNQTLDEDSETAQSESKRIAEVATAYHTYQNLLLEQNAFDFGDLICYTLRLFRERPHILAEYCKKFKYTLIDEFQDTNLAQYELIKLLTAPKYDLAVVGDDDQSIYKFRGASISNILAFENDFPNAQKIFLIDNYRSKQNILDTAYRAIQCNNPNRLEYRLAIQAPSGTGLSKRLIAANKGDGIIEYVHAKTHFDEGRAVVDKILALKERDQNVSWNDFAILVRANDHANIFIRELSGHGVPHQFLASRGLYTKPIVLDIIAYLKVLDNYHESPSLYRVLNLPIWNITQGSKIELLHYASKKSVSLYAALQNAALLGILEPELKEIQKLLSLIGKHGRDSQTLNIGQVTLAFLNESGYLTWLTKTPEKDSILAIHYLNILWRHIQKFETEEKEPTTKNFLTRFQLELEAGEEGNLPAKEDEGPEAVKILTIHAAKGLEFRYVFIVHLVDQKFPSRERKETIQLPDALIREVLPDGDIHLEEERRLFYVACTRAKEGLFFTAAEDYGGTRERKPSRFLFEAGIIKPTSKNKKPPSMKSNITEKPILNTASIGEGEPSKPRYARPEKLSFTQIKAFQTCPLQYKFAHILKIPVRGRGTFSFGKSIHAVLQKFFGVYKDRQTIAQGSLLDTQSKDGRAVGNVLSREELIKIYKENFIDDWFNDEAQKQAYYQKGIRVLQSLYESVANTAPEIVALELQFSFKIGNQSFKGVIDRVDRLADGTLEIIDYKTGQSKNLEEVDKEQLLVYQLAGRELFKEPISKLTFWYIEDGNKVSFIGAEEDLEKLRSRVTMIVDEMQQSTFPPTPSEFKCKFCDFKDICEFRVL